MAAGACAHAQDHPRFNNHRYWHLAASRLPPCPHERKGWLEPQMLSIRWYLRLIGKIIQVACSVAKRLLNEFDKVAVSLLHQSDKVAVSLPLQIGRVAKLLHKLLCFFSSGQAGLIRSRACYSQALAAKPWLQALGGNPSCKPLCSHWHALAQHPNCGKNLAASRFAGPHKPGCNPFCWVTQARLQADPRSAHLQLIN